MGYRPDINQLLPEDAVALQAMRVVNDEPRVYTPLTAKDKTKARSFCYTWLNRCRAFGMLAEPRSDEDYAIIDVLDDEGDIVAEFCVTREGFQYLASKLKWKWENRDEFRQ